MPSPFPGMDPFLEEPEVFPDLHDSLIIHLKETIQARLPKNYYAVTGARVWLEMSQHPLGPDVRIHQGNGLGGRSAVPSESAGGILTRPRANPVVVSIPRAEIRETFLEIYVKKEGGRRLVTSLEVLSPTNKTPRVRGRNLYLKKQKEMLSSQVHLVEIDLLRGGKHSTAVPLPHALEKTGGFDYHVCVHRFDRPEDFFLYPLQLQEALPAVAIPLLPGDEDVDLPLQEVFDAIYDAGPYQTMVDYRGPVPPPALSAEKTEWVGKQLKEIGINPS